MPLRAGGWEGRPVQLLVAEGRSQRSRVVKKLSEIVRVAEGRLETEDCVCQVELEAQEEETGPKKKDGRGPLELSESQEEGQQRTKEDPATEADGAMADERGEARDARLDPIRARALPRAPR